MKSKTEIASRRGRIIRSPERGVALVIVLAFVVLLTGLIVAYFSRTMTDRQLSNSSFNQSAADALAKSALDIITSGLKQEIVNGSTVLHGDPANPVSSYPAVYLPTSNAYMMPVKNTPTNPVSTLIRISTTNAIASPGVDYQASSASSTGFSANGRAISAARWNQHYLLPLANGTTPLDTTPVSTFTAPSWVYVTGTGGPANPPLTPATSGSSGVIGRYAYAIYDEGALLDANVAGYPNSSGTMPSQFAIKGSLAFADLTQLTGSTGNPLVTGTGVNNLVGWRNYASLTNATGSQPAGNFPNFTFTGTSALAPYVNMVLSNTNSLASMGYLKVSGSIVNGLTDQVFLSRQQLINMVQAIYASGTANFNPAALQYLGTFSRAVNAPSWSPPADASDILSGTVHGSNGSGNIYAYKTNAESAIAGGTNNPNRDIPNVRFTITTATTITHYDDSGNTTTYTVQPGDSLIQRRFSLAKIAWLTPTGPATGMDQAIQACFGLHWNASKWRWDYYGSTGSAVQSSIKTLDKVVAENREPNFFELLKAGILAGSLGKDPGVPQDMIGSPATLQPGVYANFINGASNYRAAPDLHALQIGANIIDQFDTDSYPTAIYLQYFPGLDPKDELAINTVYGIENLPSIYGIGTIAIADPAVGYVGDPTSKFKSWIQLNLWNPNQYPSSPLTNRPSQLRAYAYGNIYTAWTNVGGSPTPTLGKGTNVQFDKGDGTGTNISSGQVYFTDIGDRTFYNNPVLLTVNGTNTSGGAIVDTTATPAANTYNNNPTLYSSLAGDSASPANQFAGFYCGAVNFSGYATKGPGGCNKFAVSNPIVYFSLQYKGSDGNYHPYNFVTRFYDANILVSGYGDNFKNNSRNDIGATSWNGFNAIRVDPRTDRFAFSNIWWTSGQTMSSPNTLNSTPNAFMHTAAGAATLCLPSQTGFTYKNSSGMITFWSINDPGIPSLSANNAFYSDPDGVVRYADSHLVITGVSTGDGGEQLLGSAAVTPVSSTLTSPNTAAGGSALPRRPVILNRSFRSVAELGFAHRDLPFKSLDFWTSTSADSALLDLFSVADEPPVIAGQVNISNSPTAVLQSIISGGAKSDALGIQISGTDAATLSSMIAADISANGPYKNRADLALRFGPTVSGTAAGVAFNVSNTARSNWANKSYAEAPVRALADVANTRTWNLLIDVIAQTGNFTTSNVSDLNRNFTVQGERRYWLHVAIDRYTGKVVDQQLEPVYE